jgi:hypothetical protein
MAETCRRSKDMILHKPVICRKFELTESCAIWFANHQNLDGEI